MLNIQEIMTAQEVAGYLKIAPLTVYRMAQQGKLPAFKVGSDWRFKRSAVDRWIMVKSSPPPTVLAVDDEPSVLKLLDQIFSKEGYRVVSAADGETAVALLDDVIPDVAVVDLKLPGMDGAVLIGHLRQRIPDLPIVIITGYPESDLMERAMKAGPFTVLAKPFNPTQLVELVNQWCWGTRQRS